jgi:septal ring factor EnvC (AmiA/AmiB activator)
MRIGQMDSGFDLNIKIDNGIKVTSLLGTLAGAALLIWNPAGWAVAVISGLTLLVSLGKALRAFFSSDYKKSQQRQSADENLDTLSRKMRRSLRESLSAAIPDLESRIGGLKDALNEPAHQAARISATLVESVAKLTRLSNSIDDAIGTR